MCVIAIVSSCGRRLWDRRGLQRHMLVPLDMHDAHRMSIDRGNVDEVHGGANTLAMHGGGLARLTVCQNGRRFTLAE